MWGGLALMCLTGCGRVAFDAIGTSDAVAADTGPCTTGPWGALVVMSGIASSAHEYGPTLRSDGLELFFQSTRKGDAKEHLYVSRRTTTVEPFATATEVVELNSTATDSNLTLSRDGLTAYFTSDRTGGMRLYRATRSTLDSQFGAPSLIPELASAMYGPALSSDGRELFYTGGTLDDIHRATFDGTTFTAVGRVAELDGGYEGYPALSSDGLTIFYDARRGGEMLANIYTATRPAIGASFGGESRFELSIAGTHFTDAEISADGRSFLLSRPGPAGDMDLHMSTRSCD